MVFRHWKKKLINVPFSYLQKAIIQLFVQLFDLGNLRHSCNVLTCNRALKLDSRTTKKLNALTTVIEKKMPNQRSPLGDTQVFNVCCKASMHFFSEECRQNLRFHSRPFFCFSYTCNAQFIIVWLNCVSFNQVCF